MQSWLFSLPRADMLHCIKKGVFGAARRGVLGKAQKGDKVLFYVTKECKVIGHGELTSNYFFDDSPIFIAEGVFPDRVKFGGKVVSSSAEIDVRTIVNDLSFVSNKAYWSVFFRFSNCLIPQHDYELVLRKLSA